MPDPTQVAELIADTADWNARVGLIRRIPEDFGTALQPEVYAIIAQRVYVPSLEADFAYMHWRSDYELPALQAAYDIALARTASFSNVSAESIESVLIDAPQTLRVFRLLLGFTLPEFAEACALIPGPKRTPAISKTALNRIEHGGTASAAVARVCAQVIDGTMSRTLFPARAALTQLRLKVDKPDTAEGWATVRYYAAHGVPLSVLLHQRSYGGAFRQLLDATSADRGNLLESPVEALFRKHGIPFLQTGSHNQAEIETRFGLTVRPAPDFVVFDDRSGTLRAVLECKVANDGGTARDKAARFSRLRAECNRLGGVPVFAVLGGIGWRRTADALGPVVRDTDGRTFGLPTLAQITHTEPFPGLIGQMAEVPE